MTQYRMTITDEAAASMAASILDRKRQQVDVLNEIMKDMTSLSERLRNGSVSPQSTYILLDEMWDLIYDVASELTKDLPKEES